MSAERRWNARRYHLEESTTLNNNRRTVFIEHMTPNTSVPPHYHTRFTETFDLISGSMILYSSSQPHSSEPDLDALAASSQKLVVGGKHVSMTPGLYHQYVAGDEDTTVRVILTPGHRDFEQLLMVLNGMAEDGELEGSEELHQMKSVLLQITFFPCTPIPR